MGCVGSKEGSKERASSPPPPPKPASPPPPTPPPPAQAAPRSPAAPEPPKLSPTTTDPQTTRHAAQAASKPLKSAPVDVATSKPAPASAIRAAVDSTSGVAPQKAKLPKHTSFDTKADAVKHLKQEGKTKPPTRPGAEARDRARVLKRAASRGTSGFYPSNVWDHYEVKENGILGQGNFGIVLKVEERATGTMFAMKCVSKVVLADEQLEDLQREVDIMNKIGRSLNCVYLYSTYEDDAHVYLVMELCSGGSLFSRIRGGDYTEKRVAEMVRSSLQVCAQCHSKYIVYRDLKPQNFLLLNEDKNSALKATDFGLAAYMPPGSPPLRDTTGTPFYMAPEVIKKCYSFEADIWSAGVVAYQLLTGRLPFPGPPKSECKSGVERVIKSFQEIVSKEIDFTSPPWPNISPGAKDLVQRMLDRDVRRRITALEALDHPWLVPNGTAPDTPLSGSVVQRLQRFGTYGRFKQTLLKEVSCRMFVPKDPSTEELKTIGNIFQKMDADGSGAISYAELKDGLKEGKYELSSTEVEQLLASSDLDGSGDVDEEEFVSALLDWSGVEQKGDAWEKATKDAFLALDKDGTGTLDGSEIAELLGVGERNSPEVQEALRDADKNGDGEISLSEFLGLLAVNKLDVLNQYDRRLSTAGASGSGGGGGGGGRGGRWAGTSRIVVSMGKMNMAGVAGAVKDGAGGKAITAADRKKMTVRQVSALGTGGRLVHVMKDAVDLKDILISSHKIAEQNAKQQQQQGQQQGQDAAEANTAQASKAAAASAPAPAVVPGGPSATDGPASAARGNNNNNTA